jgi:hypothetical protein
MQKIEEFDAVDNNNNKYRVVHFKSIKSVADLDNPGATILGLSDYKLSNGDSINQITDTEFELLRPKIRIFRK